MPDPSAEYGGLFHLTCILYEGTITYANAKIHAAGSSLEPSFVFSAEIGDGDYVGLHVDTGNTAAATGFLPVVQIPAAASGIIGRVIDEPRWSNAPQASQATWGDQLAAGYYRIATVEFFTVTGAHGAFIEGDTADVLVGSPLIWNLTLDAWLDNGTTFTGAFSFHYYSTATKVESLVGFGHFTGTTGNDDCVGIDTIA